MTGCGSTPKRPLATRNDGIQHIATMSPALPRPHSICSQRSECLALAEHASAMPIRTLDSSGAMLEKTRVR